MPELIVPGGTMLDAETARLCGRAGAWFLISPCLDVKVVTLALTEGVVPAPSPLTRT